MGRILVTGGTCLWVNALTSRLISAGYIVRVVSRSPRAYPGIVQRP